MQLDVSPQIEARLVAAAHQRGINVAALIEKLAVDYLPTAKSPNPVVDEENATTQGQSEFAEFEGRLALATDHNRQVFRLEDEIFGHILCRFDEDHTSLATVRQLVGERVSVFGETKFTADGKPKEIQVEAISRLSSDSKLPSFADMQKLAWQNRKPTFDMVKGLQQPRQARRPVAHEAVRRGSK